MEKSVAVERAIKMRVLWTPSTRNEGDMICRLPVGADTDVVEMMMIAYHAKKDLPGVVEVIRPTSKKQKWSPFGVWHKSAKEEDIWDL